MINSFRLLLAALALSWGLSAARADFNFTAGTGTTSVGFDASHSGTSRCAAASTVCFAFVPMDTAGGAFGVTGNPLFINFASGVNLPAFAAPPHVVVDSGSVAVTGTFWQTTQPVSGTFWQATQPTSHVSGSVLSGAFAQGAIVDLGAIGNTVCATDNGVACTLMSLVMRTNANLTTLNTTAGSAIPAGSALIGSVSIDQTTPGTTNKVVASVASGGIASGAIASGAVASGAVASGAFASGSIASGAIAAGAQVDLLTMRGTKAPGTAAANSILSGGLYNSSGVTLTDGQQAAVQLDAKGGLLLGGAGYPAGATPITASATGTTVATSATLAGTSGKTTYICGYSIRANATAATTVTNTITGVITATLSSIMWVAPLASGLGVDEQIFSPCIPASGTNQAIVVVSGAPGSGGTVSSKGWGYQL